jgi:chromosome segregation ATPase
MKNKIYLIVFGLSLLFAACIFLIIVFNYERLEAKNSLNSAKAKLEEAKDSLSQLQAKNAQLKESISTLEMQVKTNELSLQESRNETLRLKDSNKVTNEALSDCKNQIAKLRQDLLKLRPQIERLRSENESLRRSISSQEKQKEIKIEEDKLCDLLEQYGITALKPQNFISDYSGEEAFLKDCLTDLCKKIKLNISGIGYAQKGDFLLAEDCFREALKIDPSFKPAKMNLGFVYEKTRSNREAADYWREILSQ